jgi:hypothetical protein
MAIIQSIKFSTTDNGSDWVHRDTAPSGGILIGMWDRVKPLTGAYPRTSGNCSALNLLGSNWRLTLVDHNGYVETSGQSPISFAQINTEIFAEPAYIYGGDYTYSYMYKAAQWDLLESDLVDWWWTGAQVIVGASAITIRQWSKVGRSGVMIKAPEAWAGSGTDVVSFADIRQRFIDNGMSSGDAAAWTPSDITHYTVGEYNDSNVGYGGGSGVGDWYGTHEKVEATATEPTLSWLDAWALNSAPDTGAWADHPLVWSSGADLTDHSGNSRDLSLTSGGTLYQGLDFEDGLSGGVSVSEAASATDIASETTTNTGTITEASTASDTISETTTNSGSITESASSADTVSQTTTNVASISEVITASDSCAKTTTNSGSLTEAASATDTPSQKTTNSGTISESSMASDTTIETTTNSGSITESASSSDSISQTTTNSGSISEPITAIDTISQTTTNAGTISESATASETITKSYVDPGVCSINESVNAGDSTSETTINTAAISESASSGDIVSQITINSASITESSSASDATTESYISPGTGAIIEAASAIDLISETTTNSGSISESANSSDYIVGNYIPPGACIIVESLAAFDYVACSYSGNGQVTELANAQDLVECIIAGKLALGNYALSTTTNLKVYSLSVNQPLGVYN